MTIALGILACDGLVVASDTLHTIDRVWKGDRSKVMSIGHRGRLSGDVQISEGACLISGTGRSSLIEALGQKLLRNFNSDHSVDDPDVLRDRFEGVLRKFLARNVTPYGAFPDNGDDLQIVIAYQRNSRYGLWSSSRASLTNTVAASVGIGQVRAQSLLARMGQTYQLTVREAIPLAAYAVYDAKTNVDGVGVGFNTDVGWIENHQVRRVPQVAIEALEEQFRKFSEQCETKVLQHVLGGFGADVPTETLEDVRAAIEFTTRAIGSV